MNFVEKTISVISPKLALRRAQSKAALNIVERGFEGARRDRRTRGWNVSNYEDPIKLGELKTLKNRSRDLYRNNSFSHRAHNSIANKVTGIGIVPAIKNETLKEKWKEWAKSTTVDFDGIDNFYGLQSLVMRTISMHGEVLILRIRTSSTDRVPLELKVISTKYLDASKEFEKIGTGYIEGGIEYDSKGKRVAYWIFPRDPQTHQDESIRWNADDVIHLYFRDEPGQSRGVPFGVSSMMSLRDYDDYADAQLMRQKIAACFSIFITKTDGEMYGGDPAGAVTINGDNEQLERVEPGMIEYLDPGKEVTFASPPPAENYGEYSRNVLTSIASGYGMSYEAMTGDLSNVNYSSGRMGFLEYQDMIEVWQHLLIIPRFCNRVWSWFCDAAKLLGSQGDMDLSVEWTAPGRKMIDPVKEVKGLVDQVRGGLMSWQEAVRKLGYSPEEILEEMKQAKDLFDQAGLQPYSDPRFDKTTKQQDNNATAGNTNQD